MEQRRMVITRELLKKIGDAQYRFRVTVATPQDIANRLAEQKRRVALRKNQRELAGVGR